MGSAVSWALYCAFLRVKPKAIGGNAFVAVSAVIGAVMLLPVLALRTTAFSQVDLAVYFDADFLLGLAYLVIFPSWLSYLLWNKGILAISATRGEIYSHLIPLSGGLLSAVVIASGIAFCSGRTKKEKAAEVAAF